MDQADVLVVMREALLLMLKMAAPMLIISILVGLIVAVFQAATQIHEQTLTFVPKVLAIALLLLFTGGWMIDSMTDFIHYLFDVMRRL